MLELAFKLVRSILSGYGALYLVTGLVAPTFFMERLSPDGPPAGTPGYRRNQHNPLKWPKAWLAIIGWMVFAWHASWPIVDVIPYEWGSHDEDGDWQSVRPYLQAAAALFTIPLVGALDNVASAAYKARHPLPED